MGILDDAIREHLDLKRRQGAEDTELARLEDEAFGPPTRPGDPDFPEDEPQAEAGTAVAEPPSDELPAFPEASAPAVEAPPAEPVPAEPEQGGFYDQSGDEPGDQGGDELDLELDLDLEPAEEAPAPPPEAPSEEAGAPPITDERPAVEPTLEPAPEPESEAPPPPPPIESLDTVEHQHDFEPPIESLDTVEHHFEGAIEDTGEAAAVEPAVTDTGEAEVVEHPVEDTGEVEVVEGELEVEGEGEEGDDEDVLEETPEFLRDQPEDDELWFEQGEPKDFDF